LKEFRYQSPKSAVIRSKNVSLRVALGTGLKSGIQADPTLIPEQTTSGAGPAGLDRKKDQLLGYGRTVATHILLDFSR
jgi:hypothetical protein